MAVQTSLWGEEKDIPEVQIYLTPSNQIEAQTYLLNKHRIDEVEALAEPYYKFAKKHRCYVLDKKGNKSYPTITDMVFNGMKMLKKDWINLYVSLNNLDNFVIFYESMPKKEQELFQYVLCHHYIPEELAKKILEKKTIIESRYYYWDETREPAGNLKQWYTMERAKSSYSKYANGNYLELKEGMYSKFLPIFYENLMNVPVHKKLSEKEKKGLTIYSGENDIFMLMPILSSLYDSKQIPFGRSKVSTIATKKAAKMLNMKEFFPTGDKDTSILAATYLINSYSLYYESHTKSKKNKLETQDILRDLIVENNFDDNILIPLLLPQITGFRKSMLEASMGLNFMGDILGTFIELDDKEWIEINQFCFRMRTFSEESEENYLIFYVDDLNKVDLFNQYDKKDVYIENFYHEISIPLIKSYLFMMATLGLVEIAYSEVSADDKNAASCLDGLKYVRLTNLGKYALSITDKYVRTKEEDITYFELDTENLIIKSLVDANPYESLLGSLAEHISKKMYKVTPESFLKDCDSKKDIENRIAIFKDYVCDKPSANWSTFFKQMLDRCSPMIKPQKQYKLLQLPAENKELQRIVLSDPNIRKYILKAEDYHILVEQDNYKKFCDTLKKYGYLL